MAAGRPSRVEAEPRHDVHLPAAAQEHGDDSNAHRASAQHQPEHDVRFAAFLLLLPVLDGGPGGGAISPLIISPWEETIMSATFKRYRRQQRRSCRYRRNPAAAAQLLRQFADQPDRRRLRGVRPRRQHPRLRAVRAGQVVLRRRRFPQPPAAPAARPRAASTSTRRRPACSAPRSRALRAVQGPAIGGGLGLALMPDFRVTCAEARFAANFTRLGFHPGFSLTFTLPRLIGQQKANLMFHTGRRIGGEQAVEWGLADVLVPLADVRKAAMDLAHGDRRGARRSRVHVDARDHAPRLCRCGRSRHRARAGRAGLERARPRTSRKA